MKESKDKKDDPTLTPHQITAAMDTIHETHFDLTTLPITWQREIDSIGSRCAGGGEHIFWMMLVLVGYALGTGATVNAELADGDSFKASANIIVALIQASGGGKTPVAVCLTEFLRRLGKRVQEALQELEDTRADTDGRPSKRRHLISLILAYKIPGQLLKLSWKPYI